MHINETTFLSSYMQRREIHLEQVQTNLANFVSNVYGDRGKEDYHDLRNANIIDNNIFSVSIPWVLADLCGIDASKCIGIASSWEGIMLYVRQLDTISDKKTLSFKDKQRMLTASMLLIHGIEKLKEEVKKSSSDNLHSLFYAAKHQLSDLLLAENSSQVETRSEKEHIDIMHGKNAFVKVIQGFYLENSNIDPSDLEEFIDNLAIFSQIIDDVKDLEIDISEASYSHLLSLGESQGLKLKSPTRAVYLLVKKGLLRRSLELATQHLLQATLVAKKTYSKETSQSVSAFNLIDYLDIQYTQMHAALVYVTDLEKQKHIENTDIETLKSKINTLVAAS